MTIDTGQKSMTGGRLARIKKYLNPKENIFYDIWRWCWFNQSKKIILIS